MLRFRLQRLVAYRFRACTFNLRSKLTPASYFLVGHTHSISDFALDFLRLIITVSQCTLIMSSYSNYKWPLSFLLVRVFIYFFVQFMNYGCVSMFICFFFSSVSRRLKYELNICFMISSAQHDFKLILNDRFHLNRYRWLFCCTHR